MKVKIKIFYVLGLLQIIVFGVLLVPGVLLALASAPDITDRALREDFISVPPLRTSALDENI